MAICAWHECGREFSPSHHLEKFCCQQCRIDRGSWKARRGAPLVDLLLNKQTAELEKAGDKLREEVKNAVPKT